MRNSGGGGYCKKIHLDHIQLCLCAILLDVWAHIRQRVHKERERDETGEGGGRRKGRGIRLKMKRYKKTYQLHRMRWWWVGAEAIVLC